MSFPWRFILKIDFLTCINGICWQFIFHKCVNVLRVGFFCFGWWTNQRGLSPKQKKCQGCPPKLINMTDIFLYTTLEIKIHDLDFFYKCYEVWDGNHNLGNSSTNVSFSSMLWNFNCVIHFIIHVLFTKKINHILMHHSWT